MTFFAHLKKFIARTWQFFASVIVVAVAFTGQFHDLKSPSLILEVTSVKATSAQPVDFVKYPELSSLKLLVGDDDYKFSLNGDSQYSPDEVDRMMLIYKGKISTMDVEIDKVEKKLGAAISDPDAKSSLTKLKSIDDTFSYTFSRLLRGTISSSDEIPNPSTEQQLELLKVRINKKLEDKRRDKENLSTKYKDANKQWNAFKTTVMPSRTKLVIICAIGNQGSGATSLKPQALFRANLGEGNYLDFPMKMSDYDSSPEAATLQAQSYKVVKFESDEIQSMTAADRERFKSFLGNASPARVFVSDVRGDVYASNSVPFSPGVYEQKMFDSLKQFASSKTFR